MKFDVTAVAFDPYDPGSDYDFSAVRTEEIDTETNELFHGCRSPWEVEDTFEAFWNRLNSSWEYDFPTGKEKVKVIAVTER